MEVVLVLATIYNIITITITITVTITSASQRQSQSMGMQLNSGWLSIKYIAKTNNSRLEVCRSIR